MAKEVLGIDIDEVLADTLASFLSFYNSRYGTGFKREEFHIYHDWGAVLGKPNFEIIDDLYKFILSNESLSIPPIPGSRNALEELSERYDEALVTYRSSDFEEMTHSWLNLHYPGLISRDAVNFANHYSTNDNSKRKKSQLANSLGIRRIIEDQVPTAVECAQAGIEVLLFPAPWNKTFNIPPELSIQRLDETAPWRHATEILLA